MINFKSPSLRITLFITLFPLIPLFFYGIISHVFFVITQENIIRQDIERTKKMIMNIEQKNLREKTEDFARFIKYYENENIKDAKERIKEHIYFITEIINNLCEENKDTIDAESLKKTIIKTLENTKLSKNTNYTFLLDLKGNTLAHRDSTITNTNVINLRDAKGKYFIKEFLAILEKKDEGFSNYYWNENPENKSNISSKTTFIKKLSIYDWFIGAGTHTDNISLTCRNKFLNNIQQDISFNDGYMYITNSKNEIILPLTNDLSHLKIPKKQGFNKDEHYITYTIYIEKFDWYITAVKDLEAIKNNISSKKQEHEKAISNEIKTSLSLITLSWVISLFISIYLSLYIFRKLKKYESEIGNTNQKLIFQSRQATIGELLPMIAHQWRQPINKIASIIAVIRLRLSEKNTHSEGIDSQCQEIEDNIEFMSETIDNFRTFYEPKEHKKQENLKTLIEKSLALLEEPINKKGIEIILELDDVTMELYGNEFMQVIINLIENSIEASPQDGGKILISLHRDKTEKVIIMIEDNGPGIDEQLIQRIFDPYFSTKKGSMGLGLHMSKIIIQKHLKGQMKAENISIGTRFTITL